MTDDPIRTAALARLEKARADVNQWETFLRGYDELAGVALPRDAITVSTHHYIGRTTPLMLRAAQGALADTQAAAVSAIKAAGGPLQTRALLEKLIEMGIEVGGQDPASTLSARLSRAPLLENVRPYGWRLREEIPQRDEAEGTPSQEAPPASRPTPHSADEDGREVEHENTDLIG